MKTLLAATAALMIAAPAYADQEPNACGPRDRLVEYLDKEWHETHAGIGVMNRNVVIELFVSADGTFTVVASHTSGKSCIIAEGVNWTETGGNDAESF